MRDFKISRHWTLPGYVLTGHGWDFGHFASVQDAVDFVAVGYSVRGKFNLTIV